VTNCYDRAGRVKSVSGTKTGESTRTYVSEASYDAGGGLDQVHLGNGRWEDWDYNGRKQVTGIKVGTTAGGEQLLGLGYGYGTTNNNGNVRTQTISRNAGAFQAAETYT
jgi:hypothetical protein